MMQDAIAARDVLREGVAGSVTVTALDVALALGNGHAATKLHREHEPQEPFVVDTTGGTYRPAA
jgi:hypothetical protein